MDILSVFFLFFRLFLLFLLFLLLPLFLLCLFFLLLLPLLLLLFLSLFLSPSPCRLNFGVPLSHLPLETRLCLTLYGLDIPNSEPSVTRTPIAWVTQRLFDCTGGLIFGPRVLRMWCGSEPADPLDSPYSNWSAPKALLIELGFEEHGGRVICPLPPSHSHSSHLTPSHFHTSHPHNSQGDGTSASQLGPAPNTYRGLKKLAEKDRLSR